MWKKIKGHLKENGLKYIVALLSLLFGADQAAEYGVFGSEAPGHLPRIEKPAPERGAWRATVWVFQAKKTRTEGLESHSYTDCLGLFTVNVPGLKHPTDEAILAAIGDPVAGLEGLTIRRVSVEHPDGWKDGEPGEIPGNIPPDQ